MIAPNGPLPRSGPFRSMTRLADLLCAAGHRVVRADLRGFGEAEADVPEATIHEHYRRIERGLHVDDLRAVTAALDDDGRRSCCSGAAAARSPRCVQPRATSACAPSSAMRSRWS